MEKCIITMIHIDDCISREGVPSFLQDGRVGWWGCGGENHELPFKNVPSNTQPATQTIYGYYFLTMVRVQGGAKKVWSVA